MPSGASAAAAVAVAVAAAASASGPPAQAAAAAAAPGRGRRSSRCSRGLRRGRRAVRIFTKHNDLNKETKRFINNTTKRDLRSPIPQQVHHTAKRKLWIHHVELLPKTVKGDYEFQDYE